MSSPRDRRPRRARRPGDSDADTSPIPRVPASPQRQPGRHHREDEPAPDPGHAHGHSHSHEPPPPASTRLRTLITMLLGPLLLAVLVLFIALFPTSGVPKPEVGSGTPVDGTVVSAKLGPCVQGAEELAPQGGPQCTLLDIKLTGGPAAGTVIHKVEPLEPSRPRFAVGDDIVLAYNGTNPDNDYAYLVMDYQRDTPLLLLAAIFVAAVLLLGRWHGARALVGLGVSALVLGLFIVPAILTGEDPLLVGITGAGLIMFVTLYATHGVSVRTSVALLGTLASLLLIGLISAVFAGMARLTGLDQQTGDLIATLGHGIDARGLLLAGVVIGALGVLDDVTVTQTSAIWELRQANPALGWRSLYAAGVRIGRDHVAAAVNTLVLAYAGAALPVLLYTAVSGVGLGTMLTSQDIAQEILRTLAGSIGIVAAVPLTSVLAAVIVSREAAAEPV